MKVRNVPGRAIRKLHKDGLYELYQEGENTLFEDFIIYRIIYDTFVKDKIDTLTREDILDRKESHRHDKYSGSLRSKGARGFRGSPDPYTYEPGDRFVSIFSDAFVLGPVGPALTTNGSVIADSVGTPPIAPRRTGVSLARSMRLNGIRLTWQALSGDISPEQQIKVATLATSPWNNYYHWTIECLLRVRLLEKYGAETGIYPTLLVPAGRSSWMDEALELINYTGEVTSIDRGIVKVDTLVVPTFPDPIPVECSWIRDRMLENVDSGQGAGERIYISRRDATVRQVSNKDEIESVLARHGIDTYVLSELSVEDQVELFNSADFVVSPHGAGLTNIVYGEDMTVIELFGDKRMATFDRIAENMGHNYQYLECEQDGIDIHVDLDDLDRTLEQADETSRK